MFHSLRSSQIFLLLVCIICTAQCLHIHRPHRHYNRRDVTTASIPDSSAPSSNTQAAELIDDVTAIEESLSSLPQTIFEFLKEIDDRLHQQEALLESLLAVFTSPSETASATASASSSSPSTTVLLSVSNAVTETSTDISGASASFATATACRRGGAGPLVPCSSSLSEEESYTSTSSTFSPSRSRITRTLTRTTYLQTTQTPSEQAIPFSNTTSFDLSTIPSLPTPTVYSSLSTDGTIANETAISAASETLAVAQSAPSAKSTDYIFKTSRQNNVAVYYGQTSSTKTGGLMELCQNDNVDIVVLAFVTSFFTNGGFPSASFGPSCRGSTAAQQLHAPGLQDCSDLAPEIVSCQALGKPVLVSLGGYYSNVTFTSDTEAIQLAENLWNLFGAGKGLDANLRPFGRSVVIDGFDLDNESHNPTSYGTFANALRTLFDSDSSKKYYLSAAPQCPRPDASIPLDAMALCDFVFVQFYNNPSCDLSSEDFEASFTSWSSDLARRNRDTKIYIGAAGFEGAGSGYVEGAALGHQISLARQYYVENLGGIMLWDGTEALANVDEYGNDFLVYAKGSLE